MEDDAAIGKNLADLRVARGLSQGDLAIKIGVAQQTIAKVEKGTRALKYVEAILICAALKVPISALAARNVASSAALMALTTQVWEIAKSIDEPSKRLADALVQLSHEIAAIRAGIRQQPAQFEYDRAVAYLETDWGRNLNETLTQAIRMSELIVGVDGIDGDTYQDILRNLTASVPAQTEDDLE